MLTLVAATLLAGPPNVLILQTDEHHPKTIGCYGGTIVKTPHLDSIAAGGVVCDSFYATTPVCSPSRACMVTGRYPQNNDVVTNNIPLRPGLPTFATQLKTEGYATGFAGKWHLAGGGKPQWNPPEGFGFDDRRFMFNRGHWKKFEITSEGPRVAARDKEGGPSYAVDGADQESFATDWLTSRAIDFIDSQDGPWMYFVSYPDPHGPNTVRAPYDTQYDDVEVPIPTTLSKSAEASPGWAKPAGVTAAQIRRLMPKYYGMVQCIDDNVGRLLAKLKSRGELENTIVVMTSDHGDLCGEHCRLNKGIPCEGSARVAFIVDGPGLAEGIRVGQALGMVDFYPTLCGLLELETPAGVEGRDASGLLKGERSDWNDVAFLRSTSGKGTWLAAVSNDRKFVVSNSDPPWLIDLKTDPDEVTNEFNNAAYADDVSAFAAELLAYVEATGDPYGDISKIRGDLKLAASR